MGGGWSLTGQRWGSWPANPVTGTFLWNTLYIFNTHYIFETHCTFRTCSICKRHFLHYPVGRSGKSTANLSGSYLSSIVVHWKAIKFQFIGHSCSYDPQGKCLVNSKSALWWNIFSLWQIFCNLWNPTSKAYKSNYYTVYT